MPNLMLTNWCNYKCAYCFGIDYMAPKIAKQNMSRETFTGIIEWLSKTSHVKSIHLMGGEPTLHPDFEWFVDYLLTRDYQMTIFSNLATKHAQVYAQKLADLPIMWVVNINPPDSWNDNQRKRITESLKTLGKKATITFNIMPDKDNNTWAIDLIREYGLNKRIKVGFVLPTLTGSNYYLNDDQYHIVAEKIIRLVEDVANENIGFEFECGVPTCVFSSEQLGILWKTGSAFNSCCFSRMDISPEGKIIYCLPLATKYAIYFSEFPTYSDAKY